MTGFQNTPANPEKILAQQTVARIRDGIGMLGQPNLDTFVMNLSQVFYSIECSFLKKESSNEDPDCKYYA
jgi:hypothetical protein